MAQYALGVEYDGTRFQGYQRQIGQRTIQHVLENAVSRVADHPIVLETAGRTDSGVHATQQVVSFRSESERSNSAWVQGVNRYLDEDVRVIWVQSTTGNFHPRHSALWRRYLYIYGQKSASQVFTKHYATWVHEPLDVESMSQTAELFLGNQDFSSVRAANCSSVTARRYVYLSEVRQINDFVVFDIVANAFLYHMVRNLASILRMVGAGKMTIGDVRRLLDKRDRTLAPPTAPACGLYLVEIGFEAETGVTRPIRLPALLSYATSAFSDVELPCDYFNKQRKL